MAEKKLKIIQMLPELNSGGVERGTLEIARYLVGKGHESIVISSGGRMVGQLESEGSRHIKLEVASKSPLTLKSSLELKKILETEKPDILHPRSRVPAWVAFFALKMMPPNKRPAVITTFHGFHSVNPYSAIMAEGDIVIAVSNIVRDHITRCYGRRKGMGSGRMNSTRTIPRGVDKTVFSPDAVSDERKNILADRWGINIKDISVPVILLPARFTRLKGHSLLIKALAEIKNFQWKLVLVGDHNENPDYTSELEKLATHSGIQDRIIFGGFVSDMPAALALSDIVVSASVRPESFGRTAVEAMAMSKPVVVPMSGGFEESVVNGVTGLFYRPEDIASLSESLKILLMSEQERVRMGLEGMKRSARYFTLDRMCRKTEETYLEAVMEKKK
jgi:glycosyltransferase involved in cell wall biosynthesis